MIHSVTVTIPGYALLLGSVALVILIAFHRAIYWLIGEAISQYIFGILVCLFNPFIGLCVMGGLCVTIMLLGFFLPHILFAKICIGIFVVAVLSGIATGIAAQELH